MSVSLGKLFKIGCGDNSCRWGARGGMGTNGGCRCYDKNTGRMTQAQMEERLRLLSGISLLRQLAELPEIEAALVELVRKATESDAGTEGGR